MVKFRYLLVTNLNTGERLARSKKKFLLTCLLLNALMIQMGLNLLKVNCQIFMMPTCQ